MFPVLAAWGRSLNRNVFFKQIFLNYQNLLLSERVSNDLKTAGMIQVPFSMRFTASLYSSKLCCSFKISSGKAISICQCLWVVIANQAVLLLSGKVIYLKDSASSKTSAKVKLKKKNHLSFKYAAPCTTTLIIFKSLGFT